MRLSWWMAAGSVPAAIAGVLALELLESALGDDFDKTLLALVAGAVLFAGLAVAARGLLGSALKNGERDSVPLDRRTKLGAAAVGAAVGFILGVTSVGSGALIGVALILVFRLTPHRVVGTDVFHAAILLWAAGLAHLASDNVDWGLAGNLLVGSVPGIWIGSHLSAQDARAGAARRARGGAHGLRRRAVLQGGLGPVADLVRGLRRCRACATAVVADATAIPPDRYRAGTRLGTRMTDRHTLSHIRALEAESVHIMREVAAQLERPVLLFSGGKDSAVLLRLAEKAFRPAKFPFPVMHVDTGHNFPEVIEFRDRRMAELGERLIVASVQESIDQGRVVEESGPRASRNRLQTVTLLDAIADNRFDALIGGARRDEERARAKERVFSFRDEFGQWDPKRQRPELWNIFNGRVKQGEHVRVFPLSNWTELDVWQYIAHEAIELPSIYFAHTREVFERDGMLYAASDFVELLPGEEVFERVGALPHGRRHELHRRGGLEGGHPLRGGRRDRRHARHRARRDPRRRPRDRGRDGGPQAGGVLLMGEPAAGNGLPEPASLLRFATVGSVDDGKSTLIGRLLFDAAARAARTRWTTSRRSPSAAATPT